MAVNIKGGATVIPLTEEQKRRNREEYERGLLPSAPLPPPASTTSIPEDTLAERLAAANVAPKQPGMGTALSQRLKGIYEGQNVVKSLAERTAFREEQANAAMNAQAAMQIQQEQNVRKGFLSMLGSQIENIERGGLMGLITPESNIPPEVRGGIAVGGAALATGIGAAGTAVAAASVKSLAGATIAKTGLFNKALSSKFLKLALAIGVGGRIATAPTKMVNDAKAAIDSNVATADLIIDSVKANLISPEDAVNQFNEIDQQIATLERSINSWSMANLMNRMGGGQDRLRDIKNAKMNLQIKRRLLYRAIFGLQ